MIGQLHPDLRPDEIYSPHQIEPWLMELVSAPALLDIVEKTIGFIMKMGLVPHQKT